MQRVGSEILLTLLESNSNQNSTSIFKKTGITYTHVVRRINELIEVDLIRKEVSDGRTYNLFLTEKGKQIAESLKFIKDKLEEK